MLTNKQREAAYRCFKWFCELLICIAERREVYDLTTHEPITSYTYHHG